MYIIVPVHHAKLINTDLSIYPQVQNLYNLTLLVVFRHASVVSLDNFFVLASEDVEDGLCIAQIDEGKEGLVEVLKSVC